MTKTYDIISLNNHLYMLDKEADVKIGDWYYTSLEHDLPWIAQCKNIDNSKEYWLDNDLKYLMKHLKGAKEANYGSCKILASTDTTLGLPLLCGVEEGDIYDTVIPPCINRGDGIEQMFFNDGYWAGYEAASAKKYDEVDIFKVLHLVNDQQLHSIKDAAKIHYIIQSLTPKPIAVEVEMEQVCCGLTPTPENIEKHAMQDPYSPPSNKGKPLHSLCGWECTPEWIPKVKDDFVVVKRWIFFHETEK